MHGGTRAWASGVWIAVAVAVCAPVRAAAPEPAWSESGMVSSSAGPAAAVGREILARGGNAVDAAIATGFAAGCAHPFSSGIGGGGFLVLYRAEEGASYSLDARETAPAGATPALFRDAQGQPDSDASRSGGRAVAVPGLVQGFEAAHERFGSLPWAELVRAAERLCREGVPVSPYHQRILRRVRDGLLEDSPETARIQLDEGAVPALGWLLVQSDLADTYARIAEDGASALQQGPIAQSIVQTVRTAGGVLTPEDLESYAVRWREPVRTEYRGYRVISMPPPSSGGVALIEMLHALQPYDLRALGAGSGDLLHLLAGAMQLAFADRAAHLGDPDFSSVPTAWLISADYGRRLAERLAPPPFWRQLPWRWGWPEVLHLEGTAQPPVDDAGTTHISVIDAQGNAVALTQTVNTLFGCGLTAPGTGIVLNNEMDDFAIAPDTPNAFELVGGETNAVAPGKRPLSSMTPTIVTRDGRAVWALGSPMGPYIITTVLQTLVHLIDFEMNVQQAVSAPRVHHQWRPDVLRMEPEHPRDVVRRLERIGHPVEQGTRHFGAGVVSHRDPETGLFQGGADPRRDARAAGP